MLNVLHGRFVANPAQNSPSHIMKGKKAQMSTVSHWDWIRHPHLTLLVHKRPGSPFLSPFHATRARTSNAAAGVKSHERANIPSPTLWCSASYRRVNVKEFEGHGAAALKCATYQGCDLQIHQACVPSERMLMVFKVLVRLWLSGDWMLWLRSYS